MDTYYGSSPCRNFNDLQKLITQPAVLPPQTLPPIGPIGPVGPVGPVVPVGPTGMNMMAMNRMAMNRMNRIVENYEDDYGNCNIVVPTEKSMGYNVLFNYPPNSNKYKGYFNADDGYYGQQDCGTYRMRKCN
jgi:hypothetical protein